MNVSYFGNSERKQEMTPEYYAFNRSALKCYSYYVLEANPESFALKNIRDHLKEVIMYM